MESTEIAHLFDNGSVITVLKSGIEGGRTFALAEVEDEEGAGQFVVQRDGAGNFILLGGDSVVEVPEDLGVPRTVADLFRGGRRVIDTASFPGVIAARAISLPTAPSLGQSELNARVHEAAEAGVGAERMNSRLHAPPITNGGKLACVWAVNRIAEDTLGRPIGGGLQTTRLFEVLQAQHGPALPQNEYGPGIIVISPTTGGRVGHVGILGRGDQIYSNSSRRGRWEQNFTLASWGSYYTGRLGLPVHLFQLNPSRFAG